MSHPICRMIGSLKGRPVLSSAVTVPKSANCLLSCLGKKSGCFHVTSQLSNAISKEERIPAKVPILLRLPSSTEALPPSFPETKDQKWQREYLKFNVKQLPHPEKEPNNDQLVMDMLRDFTKKRKGQKSEDFKRELRLLLKSEQFKNLGVYIRDVRIPDKQEWKSSWNEKGKPTWLGTTPTAIDGIVFCTASVSGYSEEEGRKGGYGVIFCDGYGRPLVSSVGVLPKGDGPIPHIYYEFHGVRSALQLAYNSGFGCNFELYCHSRDVQDILDLCLESVRCLPMCMDSDAFSKYENDRYYVCSSCLGFDLCNLLEDFDLLFPVIKEIIELLSKLQTFTNVHISDCEASAHLAKCYITTAEEMNGSRLVDEELGMCETVMKPAQISDELADILYDETFKKDRIHTRNIRTEKGTEDNEATHPDQLYKKMVDYHRSGNF